MTVAIVIGVWVIAICLMSCANYLFKMLKVFIEISASLRAIALHQTESS